LGPERTRSELIPFITEFIEGDNDEAHTAVARQLGEILPYLGGATHGALVLPLLEKLCAEEEVVVRDSAVASLVVLAPQLRKDDLVTRFIPLIKRLSGNSWFATRVSSCGMIAPAYAALTDKDTDHKTELRGIYSNLCNDETPMVRKGAYMHLGEFAVKIGRAYFKSDILPILKSLATDAMDAMRVLTLDVMGTVAEALDTTEFETSLLPLIEALEDDTSWRVRQALAKQIPLLCKHVTPLAATGKLVPLFTKLLKDKEAEVRQQGAMVLSEVGAEVKGAETILGPCLEILVSDPIQTVRVSLARALVPLARRFSKEMAIKTLIPILKQLAKDESYDVRSSVLAEVDKLADYLDAAALLSIVPLLLDLSKDAKWRVRAAVVDKSAVLAKHLGVKKFEKQMQTIIIGSLSDHVYAIREKACIQVGAIVGTFGGKWAGEKLFPAVFSLYDKNANYLHRMTCLLLIQHVTAQCAPDIIEKHLLPLTLTAASDEVPNVRVASAKTLGVIGPKLDSKVTLAKITPVLKKLQTDTDGDVVHFATLSLKGPVLPSTTPGIIRENFSTGTTGSRRPT
jgi:serine/threonine-protein phosphatase 2A regulatory subunit A